MDPVETKNPVETGAAAGPTPVKKITLDIRWVILGGFAIVVLAAVLLGSC